jgi:branched-chain amino acid transport system substrate-binding protein
VAPTSSDAELTSRGYRRVFRTMLTGRSIGRQMADFAEARRLKRVAIFYIRNTYGRELANAFEERATEAGLTIAARRSYDPSDHVSERTFDALVNEWRQMPMDAIFVAGEVPSAAYFVARARAAGLKIPILGGDAMSGPSLMSVSGAAAEGTIIASVFHPDEPRAEVQTFTRNFTAKYGVAPDWAAAVGYDAVRLLAHGMRESRSAVPDEVAAALHALSSFSGVTGTFSFDAAGDVVGKHLVKLVVRKGRFEYFAEASPAVAVAAGPADGQ